MPKPKSPKVIALYIIAGFGHLKPAIALLDQIKDKYPKIQTEAWDIYADASGQSALDKNSLYNRISTHPLYLKFWNRLSSPNSISRFFAKPAQRFDLLSNHDLKQRFKAAISQNPNTVFVSTHFTPANIASKALPDQKVFLYVTDIHPHPIWAIKRKNIIYLVPVQETKEILISYGIDRNNIKVASFPIHPTLLKNNQQRAKKRIANLKKEHSTDVLIISGGAGTGRFQMENLLSTFAAPAHDNKVNITYLASTMKLRNQLKEYRVTEGLPDSAVEIDTYKPENLYKAMKWAEVMITKAGGDITFEALAEGLPIYTLKDVGAHEVINRRYLEEVGASRPLESNVYPWELIHHDLLTGKLQEMAQASYQAGAFHREANTPRVIFEELGWDI